MNDKPLVSVVIISFNRLEDLKETIERTKDIPYPNLEVILVDGGSTDGSAEYIASLKGNNIYSLILGVDKGSAYSHSKGMEFAHGKYIITIDDDCYLKPRSVEKMVEIFEKYPRLAVIGFGLFNPQKVSQFDTYWDDIIVSEDPKGYVDKYQTMNYGSACGFRKSVLEKVGYMDYDWEWSSRTEDVELNIRIIAHGYNTVLIPELVAYHKVNPSNRPADILTMNGINGVIWIILKYYPITQAVSSLAKLFYYCLYFSFYYRSNIYLKAVIRSIKKAPKMLANQVKLPRCLLKNIHLPIIWLFSISSNTKWVGE